MLLRLSKPQALDDQNSDEDKKSKYTPDASTEKSIPSLLDPNFTAMSQECPLHSPHSSN